MYSQLKESVYIMAKLMTKKKILEELDSMYVQAENLEKEFNNHHPEGKYAFICGVMQAQIEILSERIRHDY